MTNDQAAARRACREVEPALIASGAGEASPAEVARVDAHVAACAPCREALARYRAIDAAVEAWRDPVGVEGEVAAAQAGLHARLARLRDRAVAYRIFASPLGPLLLARSDDGVTLVEYLDAPDLAASRLSRVAGVAPHAGGVDLEALYTELMEFLEGRRARLPWPLDFRLVRSAFHRRVLEATADVPYGAVTSYAGIACEIGRPTATRAVAQALRWNPLPIVVPCHRIVGSAGALTGYAGDRLELKRRLLAVEGIEAVGAAGGLRIPREAMYLAYPGSAEYCVPTCPSTTQVDRARRFVYFASRPVAEAAGLAPCSMCRPDLHPLAS